MAPSRRRWGRAAAAAAARQQWKVGDLVLAKMKGFPAWPAMVSEPEKWGFSSDRKKLLVYFYGTKQIAFCNYADLEAFTEEKKKTLLIKRQGKGADFVRAVEEIIAIYDKKQKLTEVNSSEDCRKQDDGHLEGSKSNSPKTNSEISPPVDNNHQLEALCISTEHCDGINSGGIPKSSLEGDPRCTIINNDGTEKVSILDELRQTPLSTTTTTRKRQRDGSLQSSVIQRVPSLRRSKNSSGNGRQKFQKPSGGEDGHTDGDMPSNIPHEASPAGLAEDTAHVLLCCNGVSPAAALLSNDSSEDLASDTCATKSDMEVGSMDSSSKLEVSGNGHVDKDLGLSGVVTLNGKLDLPTETAILKRKRKPNRKRVSNNLECATLEKEAIAEIDLDQSNSEAPTSCKEVVENISKADGDEHLPLVKRARVRMGKPSVEETHVGEFVEEKEKLESVAPLEPPATFFKSSSPVSSPADRTSFMVKEEASSSVVDDCAVTAGSVPMILKDNKNHLKGITLDGEATLPPSKRLHRALEAMSANAAESTKDITELPTNMEISNGCVASSEATSHEPVDQNVGSPLISECAQSTGSATSHNSTSRSSLSLPPENPDVSELTPSKVESDNSLAGSLIPQKEHCKEIVVVAKECDAPFNIEISEMGSDGKFLKTSPKSIEQPSINHHEDMPDQFPSPLDAENEGKALQPSKKLASLRAEESAGESTQTVLQKPGLEGAGESASLVLPVVDSQLHHELLPPNGGAYTSSSTNAFSSASDTFGSAKSQGSLSDEGMQARSDVVRELNRVTLKDWGTSDLTPMKKLIAAAQAKRFLSRSTSFPDTDTDDKVENSVLSPVIGRGNSSVQGSPQSSMVYNRPATDDRTQNLQTGSTSPLTGQREKGSHKPGAVVEANAAWKSFEALLCTLSRTKDSIGRATRMAIDCAKYGIAREVIEILLQHLERESSLYRRVDLFFLVDSIAQFSRSQKGGVGDVYLSHIQSTLPRLLSAAAPHGNAAWENRRQCLKVLRLWLERKTLPESVVRHHIRELESVNDSALTSSYSRRPSRAERALNDPIREMEGMFVDEYGSNTSFQLQNFVHPRLLEDEEGSGDDDKSFEAVTPERSAGVEDDKDRIQTPTEKHRHILEDVDGELEMEDVAPPCEVGASSSCPISVCEISSDTHYNHEPGQSVPCGPPLPEELPPLPPPLPSSPPPMPPLCSVPSTSVSHQQIGGSHSNTDITEFHLSSTQHNQNEQPQSVGQPPNSYQGNMASSEPPVPYYARGYSGFTKPMPPVPHPLGPSDPYMSHTTSSCGNSFPSSLPNKTYPLQPPPPTVSNQFSFIQAEAQQRAQSWGSDSLIGDRYQHLNGPQRGHFFGDRNVRPIQHENSRRGRFSPAMNTGPFPSDRADRLPSSALRYGPYSGSSSNPSDGWSIPPRISSYSVSASRSSAEHPVSQVTGAPGYWQPR